MSLRTVIFAGVLRPLMPALSRVSLNRGLRNWTLSIAFSVVKRGNHYIPLRDGEIRLLHLQPGSPKDIVRCSLNRVRLSDVTNNYEALSYAWGDLHRREQILCSGAIKDVTSSLHEALKHLRYEDKVRHLWADALCINQDDVSERNKQVQRMGDIYAGAQKVLIWLGPETPEVKDALENLPSWLQYDAPVVNWNAAEVRWTSPSSFVFNQDSLSDEEVSYLRYQQRQLPAISRLFARTWWRRRWVIQEQAKARDATLVCGNSSLSWESVQKSQVSETHLNSIYYILSRIKDRSRSKAALDGFWNARTLTFLASKVQGDDNEDSHSLQLPGILDWARNFECSDSRDNLYSLLPIAKNLDNSHQPLVQVNYLDSMALLSIRLSEYLMRTAHRPLWHFSYAMGTRQAFDSDLVDNDVKYDLQQDSSWACSFLDPSYPTRHDLHIQLCFFDFDAGKVDTHKSPMWRLSPNKRVLSVKASIVGEITEIVSPRIQVDSNYHELAAWGRMVWSMANRFPSMHRCRPTAELFDDFVTGDGVRLGKGHSVWDKTTFEAAISLMEWIQRDDSDFEDPTSKILEFAAGVQLALCRLLCITSTGHLGFFPPHSMVGDKVCVVPGDKLLYVVAPCGYGHYNLIGDCYVKGLMWGEVLDLGLEERWIRLY